MCSFQVGHIASPTFRLINLPAHLSLPPRTLSKAGWPALSLWRLTCQAETSGVLGPRMWEGSARKKRDYQACLHRYYSASSCFSLRCANCLWVFLRISALIRKTCIKTNCFHASFIKHEHIWVLTHSGALMQGQGISALQIFLNSQNRFKQKTKGLPTCLLWWQLF